MVCRLIALANALDGMSREQAARHARMDRQTLRSIGPNPDRRVIRFNGAGVEGLRDRPPRNGRPSWVDEGQLAALQALVLRGPDPEHDCVSSWQAQDLCRLVAARFGVVYSENGMLRLLHDLGLSWQKARPIHPKADPAAQACFKKKLAAHHRQVGLERPSCLILPHASRLADQGKPSGRCPS